MRRWLVALASVSCAGRASDGDGGRGFVVASRDMRVAASADAEGYEYVARRPFGVVALAESRGIDAPTAHAAIDRLADALDTCASDDARRHPPVRGAARIVAAIGANGAPLQASLRVDPGAGVAESAVLCLLAPLKMLTFPPSDAGARGLAIEALWGPAGR